VRYVVLVFDRSRAKILAREDFMADQREQAWSAHDRLVRQHLGTSDVEVVMLGAASEADLHATHGRYFAPPLAI